MSKRLIGLLTALVMLAPIAARAEEGPGSVYSKDKYPEELAKRPLTLPAGMVEIYAPLNANLSASVGGESLAFKPVRINPAVYFGLTNDITVGLYTETLPTTPMFAGLCLTGESNGCYPIAGAGKGGFLAPVLNTLAGEAILSLMRQDNYQLTVFGGLEFLTIAEPTLMRARVGFGAKYGVGNVAIPVKVGAHFGLTNRDAVAGLVPWWTKDSVFVDVEPTFNVTRELAVFVHAGFGSDFTNFSDDIEIPVGVGVEYALNHNFDVGAKFEFENLLGKEHLLSRSGLDERLGTVFLKARF